MTRYAAKPDANQAEIVAAFRKLGCSVRSLHRAGQGIPDIVIGYAGHARLCEIKSATGKLTKAQIDWASDWTGGIYLIRNVGDVEACVHSMKLQTQYVREGYERNMGTNQYSRST